MEFLVIDMTPPLRASLVGRVQEAVRQAGIQQVSVTEADPLNLDGVEWNHVLGCFIGSGCGSVAKELLTKIQSARGECPIAIVLDSETYVSEAVRIHKLVGHTVLVETDLTQMATFVFDCERRSSGRQVGFKERQVIGFVQNQGGVGSSSLCLAVASSLAARGYSAVLVDFDEVSADLTEAAAVPVSNRGMVSEFVRTGIVSSERIRDALFRLPGRDQRVAIIPQPLLFQEGFHLKASVLDGAPAASEYVQHLFQTLLGDFDFVLLDCSRSWGVATFAALPWCSKIFLVVNDDRRAVKRSLEAVARLRDESGDADEFNMSKWALILNRFSGDAQHLKQIENLAVELDLSGLQSAIFPINISKSANLPKHGGESFFETADPKMKKQIEMLSLSLASKARMAQ